MCEFVPFEIAKNLKEKGFKEKCLTYYDVIDNVGLLYNTQYTDDLSPCQYTDLLQSHNTDVAAYQSDDSEYCVDAPTIPQVIKWLIEEKQLYIDVGIYQDSSCDADGCTIEKWCFWSYDIQNTLNGDLIYDFANTFDTIEFETYEEAALHGINYVLDNLI